MARRWPPPCYETEEEVGLPHERQFAIACLVASYRETGRGKSKKVAKRLAAQQMWQRLQDLPADAEGGGGEEVSFNRKPVIIQSFYQYKKQISLTNESTRRRIYHFSFCTSPVLLLLVRSVFYWFSQMSSETGSIYQSTQFSTHAINRKIDSFWNE